MPAGLQEHLAVERLLRRWDNPDVHELRAALAALLARSRAEVQLVEQTFDRLYGARLADPSEGEVKEGGNEGWTLVRRSLAAGAAILFVVATIVEVVRLTDPADALPFLQLPRARLTQDSVRTWLAAIAVAVLMGTWFYYRSWARQLSTREAMRKREAELESLPGPYQYTLVLRDLRLPFDASVLDGMAALLGRQVAAEGRRVLDAGRSIERTLRAGLVHLVWRGAALRPPLLVLEDVGGEMDAWRWRIDALFDGLVTRGVEIDRWWFHGDAGLVFHAADEPGVHLSRLAQLRPHCRLIVVSTGFGVIEG
ncbi:MAG TPA: hypothetical protein VHB47_26950, partial [Thermoanaerobaculia bacterium]|nr:hypothetical protein [Thermoanaerobaculia bacterium]